MSSQLVQYFRSPLGRELIGKNKNDTIRVKTPSGDKAFEIKNRSRLLYKLRILKI